MLKITKLCRCFSWIVINQSMTVLVFFHWLSCKFSRVFLFILSKITLLIFPSSFFAGLISLTVGLFWKSSLWSYSYIKQFFPHLFAFFSKLCCYARPAALIFFLMLLLAFLYVAVIESLVSFHILLLLSDRCLSFYLRKSLFYLMLSFFILLKSCCSWSWKWFLIIEINSFSKGVSSFTGLGEPKESHYGTGVCFSLWYKWDYVTSGRYHNTVTI